MKLGTMSGRFSPARAALLVRNRALEDAPAFAIGLGIILGANVLDLILARRAFINADPQAWATVILLGCLAFASLSFKGMHDGRAGTEWILLPASPLEKYVSALACNLLLYPLAAILAAIASSAILVLGAALAGSPGAAVWTPFAWGFAELMRAYWAYATLALALMAGSAAFRKRAPLKTLGAATVYILLVVGLLIGGFYLIARAKYDGVVELSFRNGDFITEALSGLDEERIERYFELAFKAMANVLAPLFALLYGYFRVFEKEARDEVQ